MCSRIQRCAAMHLEVLGHTGKIHQSRLFQYQFFISDWEGNRTGRWEKQRPRSNLGYLASVHPVSQNLIWKVGHSWRPPRFRHYSSPLTDCYQGLRRSRTVRSVGSNLQQSLWEVSGLPNLCKGLRGQIRACAPTVRIVTHPPRWTGIWLWGQ